MKFCVFAWILSESYIPTTLVSPVGSGKNSGGEPWGSRNNETETAQLDAKTREEKVKSRRLFRHRPPLFTTRRPIRDDRNLCGAPPLALA